jgi:anti-anti-sigma factor
MKLQSTVNGDITVISLAGELNVDSAGKLTETVRTAFREQRRDFVLDLQQLSGIDSAGLEAITALQRECDEQLGMLHLCSVDPTLQKIFEITRLDRQLSLYPNLEEAVGSFING